VRSGAVNGPRLIPATFRQRSSLRLGALVGIVMLTFCDRALKRREPQGRAHLRLRRDGSRCEPSRGDRLTDLRRSLEVTPWNQFINERELVIWPYGERADSPDQRAIGEASGGQA
jgi:hypothetical protein